MTFKSTCHSLYKHVYRLRMTSSFYNVHRVTFKLALPRLFVMSYSACGIRFAYTQHATTPEIGRLNIDENIRSACEKGEAALLELISTLSTCIREIGAEYEECIIKQMELIRVGMKMGPLGEHWDALTEFRVRANELKEELVKYEEFVKIVEEMTYTQVVSSVFSGNSSTVELISSHFKKLKELLEEVLKQKHDYEVQLLAVERQNILKGV